MCSTLIVGISIGGGSAASSCAPEPGGLGRLIGVSRTHGERPSKRVARHTGDPRAKFLVESPHTPKFLRPTKKHKKTSKDDKRASRVFPA